MGCFGVEWPVVLGYSGFPGTYEQGSSYLGLVSVIMSSWGSDMSLDMVVAKNVQHGSYLRRTP